MNYSRKVVERTRIRHTSRVKHIHNYTKVHRAKGFSVRYACDTCPAVDSRWYWMTHEQMQARTFNKTFEVFGRSTRRLGPSLKTLAKGVQTAVDNLKAAGWLSGTCGTETDPQGPQGAFVIIEDHIDEETGARVINKVELLGVSLDAGGTTGVAVIDADHPHADIPEPVIEPDEDAEDEGFDFTPGKVYTKEELERLVVADIYTIAMELNIWRRSKMKRDALIDAILKDQESK